MAQSQHINSPKLDAIHIVLILAAVFAIGSVGFFLAILLGKTYAPSTAQLAPAQLTPSQKEKAVNSLVPSATAFASGSSSSSSASQHLSQVSAQQADPNDPNAAAKLQVLNALNSQ